MLIVEIPLTMGKFALIDARDVSLIADHTWQANRSGKIFYAVSSKCVGGKYMKLAMHRLIMNPGQSEVVDHINNNSLDNTRENLRICTKRQNAQNKKSSLKYKGVSPHGKKFRAYLGIKYLGLYSTPEDAARAHDEAARELWGEYANLNFKE